MRVMPSGKTVAGFTGSLPLTLWAKAMSTKVASVPGVTAPGTGVSMDEGRPATDVPRRGMGVGAIVVVGVTAGVGVGTNPDSRRFEYSLIEALARKLTKSGLL